jgi:PAS domain S-box-containing protein
MTVLVYFAAIGLTCALTGGLAVYAWRQPPLPGVRVYAGLAFSECLLALAEILSMVSGTQAQAMFWFNLRFLFTATIPVIWLAFALAYSGAQGWLSRRLLAAAFVVPVITQVLLWSNGLHGLWVRQDVGFHKNGPFWIAETGARIPGPWFMLHSFYSLILLLAGIGVILFAGWHNRRRDRGRAWLLSAGALVALATTLIPLFNLLPHSEFNPFIPGIGISALLYALAIFRFQFLKHVPARGSASRLPRLEPQERRSLAALVFTFVLFTSGLAAAGYLTYQRFEDQFRTQVEIQLSAVAMLKVSGLRHWRDERLADASLFYRNADFSGLVRRSLEIPGDTDAQDRLARWLERVRVNPEYARVSLLDAQAREWISSPASLEPPPPFLVEQAAATLASGQISMLDLHRDADGAPIHMTILVPILDEQDGRRLGVLVLGIDPYVYLYPFVQQWPVPSQRAETLLVRRDGEDALFLNELKYVQNTALELRVPLENTEVLAVKAVLGQVGIAQGLDYRGVRVIGHLSAVPESPWFLVARMDTAEAYAPLRERLWQTVLFFGVLILAGGLGLTLSWRQQRVRYYRGQSHAAEAVRESEERYQLANRATFNAIWDWNLQTDAWWWNENFQELFGYRAEEIEPGRESWTSRIHPEDLARVQTGIRAALDSGRESWSDYYRFRCKDGRYAEIEDRGHIGREASGIPLRMIGAMQDISERRRQEAEILAAQAGLKRLLAEADQGRRALLSVVEDQRAVEEALRASHLRMEKLNQAGLALSQTRDLPAIYRTAWEHISRLVDCACFGISLFDPGTGTLRAEYMLSDGELLDSAAFPPLTFPPDQPLTGRARALRTQKPEIVSDMPAAASDQTVVVGVADDERMARSAFYAPMVVHGEVLGLVELQSYRKGAYGEADAVVLGPVANQIGMAIENARLIVDLEMERNSLAQRVRVRTAELEATSRELEAFAYSVSHDLRGPLRALHGFSAALLSDSQDQLDEQGRHYLDRIGQAATHMGELIDALLDLSRITRREMRHETVDLSALAREIAGELETQDPQRTVEWVIAEALPVKGDAPLLSVALRNLLGNAWKFSGPRAQARIEVGVLPRAAQASAAGLATAEGERVYFVRDNGAGFDMAYADKLFAPFQRLHGTREFPGTGIGLATVQRIIARHGGRVWAEAEVDRGATFYFTMEAA